jgi:hypothetical protein
MIISRRIGRNWHVSRKGGMINAYKYFDANPDDQRTLGRPKGIKQVITSIKVNLKTVAWRVSS